MTSRSIRDPDTGTTLEVLSTYRDVTARKSAERALAESERFARATVDALTTHVAILDEAGKIVSVNKAWEKFALEAEQPEGLAMGQEHLRFYDDRGTPQSKYGTAVAAGIRSVISGEVSSFEQEFPWTFSKAGAAAQKRRRWFFARISRFPGQGPTRVVVAHEDVTDLRLAAERLRHDSLHDVLTGLPHRTLFHDRVQRSIERAKRYDGNQF